MSVVGSFHGTKKTLREAWPVERGQCSFSLGGKEMGPAQQKQKKSVAPAPETEECFRTPRMQGRLAKATPETSGYKEGTKAPQR